MKYGLIGLGIICILCAIYLLNSTSTNSSDNLAITACAEANKEARNSPSKMCHVTAKEENGQVTFSVDFLNN